MIQKEITDRFKQKDPISKDENIQEYIDTCRSILVDMQASRKIKHNVSDRGIITDALKAYSYELKRDWNLFLHMSGYYDRK